MSEVSRWYPSKVDGWIAVVLAIAPVTSVVATVAVAIAGKGVEVALLGCAFLALIYLGLVFPMRYGITREALVVRHGLVRHRIALREIAEVHPTHNPLSSPALSLDRLHIRYGEGFFKAVMISPADKHAVMTELAERAGLERDGERLVRR